MKDQNNELLVLATMARNFHQRPSELLQIEDEVCAFDFDLTANERLIYYDLELEKIRIEASSGGALGKALGNDTAPQSNHKHTVERW